MVKRNIHGDNQRRNYPIFVDLVLSINKFKHTKPGIIFYFEESSGDTLKILKIKHEFT